MRRGSVPVPDLKPPPAAAPAAAVAAIPEQPRQPGPEPVTATIRKWPRKEDAAQPPRGSGPGVEAGSEAGTVSASVAAPVTASAPASAPASVAVSAPVSASVPVAVAASEPVSESVLETATESVFGTGSVTASESLPAAQPETPSMPAPAYDRPSLPEPLPTKRRGGWGAWLLAAGLGLGAYALVATGALDSVLQPATPAPAPSGIIAVAVTPADAQIFVFVGRGPAVASGLPASGAHEFIVFDHGLRPSRAVVPEGAAWTTTEQGSLYELAVQAQAAPAPTDALDLGSPETTPASTGAGDSGTIRIITNPQGAKVYRFIGVGPTAQIPAASIHEGQEILVYHPEHETRRAVIGPSDWEAGEREGAHRASLEVQLPALPGLEVPEALED